MVILYSWLLIIVLRYKNLCYFFPRYSFIFEKVSIVSLICYYSPILTVRIKYDRHVSERRTVDFLSRIHILIYICQIQMKWQYWIV